MPIHNSLLKPKITLDSDIKKIQKSQSTMKTQHDKRAKDLRPLHEGDAVVMKPMSLGKKEWTKGTITSGAGRSYEVTTQDGAVLRRNRVHLKKIPDVPPPSPTSGPPEKSPEQQNPEPQIIEKLEVPKSPPRQTSTPTTEVRTRSGRLVKKNQLQDYAY